MKKIRVFRSVLFIFNLAAISLPALAQSNTDSTTNSDDFFTQWVNYSRPGKNHQMLANLVGRWTFAGHHLTGNANPDSNKIEVSFKGTMERTSFANGRYFMAEFRGEKIQMPIQDGKLKTVDSKEIETDGYDNIKRMFVKTRIGNHLGSGISYSEGHFDSSTNTIIYQRVESPIPGVNMKTFEHLKMIDQDHYSITIYRERENTVIKDTEIRYTRVKRK